MRRSIGTLVLLGLAIGAPAHAAFHEWDVSEVFSNEDGSVQFIELFTASSGQQFIGDHFVRTEDDNVAMQTYTFETDLVVVFPETTANRRFLLATPDFLAAAGIAPDYEIPAGFIELGVADEINFASFDSFPLAGLPSDGVLALFDGGGTGTPTPTNFAGEIGTIVPEPAASALALTAIAALLALSRRR